MPQLQSITLKDRVTPTPADHVFAPRDVSQGVGVVVSNSGVPLGEEVLTVSMKKTPTKYRGRLTLKVPVVQTETINGISSPKLVRTAYASVEVVFDEKSTLLERQNLVGMLASSLAADKVLVNDAFTKLEGVYGS